MPRAKKPQKNAAKQTRPRKSPAKSPPKSKSTGTRAQNPKRQREIDDELLLAIETAVARGAESNAEIAKAIGWTVSTLKNYRYGKGKNPKYLEAVGPIETAIKRGAGRRRTRLLSEAEDALSYLLRHDKYTETRTKSKQAPVGHMQKNGKYKGIRLEEEHSEITHQRTPNAVIAMFVAVNAARETTDGSPMVRWQSINKVLERPAGAKAAILDAIEDMLEDEPVPPPRKKRARAPKK